MLRFLGPEKKVEKNNIELSRESLLILLKISVQKSKIWNSFDLTTS